MMLLATLCIENKIRSSYPAFTANNGLTVARAAERREEVQTGNRTLLDNWNINWPNAGHAQSGVQPNRCGRQLSLERQLANSHMTMQCTGVGEQPVFTWTITRANPVIAVVLSFEVE
jgi:hypothetical protein